MLVRSASRATRPATAMLSRAAMHGCRYDSLPARHLFLFARPGSPFTGPLSKRNQQFVASFVPVAGLVQTRSLSSSGKDAAEVPRTAKDVESEPLHKDTLKSVSEQEGRDYMLPHPIWKSEYIDQVEITHKKPTDWVDALALYTVRTVRFNFDWISGYSWRPLNAEIWLTRIMFLETIAGIPGMLASTLRHLRSLRLMKRDNGWIHTLLEEAENERMHLLTAKQLRNPGPLMRAAVFASQGIFFNFFFVAYLMSPRFCHRFVGYLEEEAVRTYTHCLSEVDKGHIDDWQTKAAPKIAKEYWKLPEDATMRDVIAVIRSDEAHHRNVNHTFADMKPDDANPFPPGF